MMAATGQANWYTASRLNKTNVCFLLSSRTNEHGSELLDTFFIVIHKKKLMFLHWYHHVTVLLYCWHCFSNSPAIGIVFVAMNFGVHALMYGYYFLMAIRMKPSWFNPISITFLQSKYIQYCSVWVAMTFWNGAGG